MEQAPKIEPQADKHGVPWCPRTTTRCQGCPHHLPRAGALCEAAVREMAQENAQLNHAVKSWKAEEADWKETEAQLTRDRDEARCVARVLAMLRTGQCVSDADWAHAIATVDSWEE